MFRKKSEAINTSSYVNSFICMTSGSYSISIVNATYHDLPAIARITKK